MLNRTELIIADTKRLVAIPSVRENELAIANQLFADLRDMGHRQVKKVGEANNVACLIPGENRRVLFVANGHIDTVPFDGPEHEVFRAIEDGEWLIGPGAGDMKAGDAIMLDVAREYQRKKPPCDILLSFVDREELDSAGAQVHSRWINKNLRSRYDHVGGIILEPTYREVNGEITGYVGFGHRGGVNLRVEAGGPKGHAGQDFSHTRTAIGTIGNFVDSFPAIQSSWEEEYSDEFGKPTINATWLFAAASGMAQNIVPDRASAGIALRTTRTFAESWTSIQQKLHDDFPDIVVAPFNTEDLAVSQCDPQSRIYQVIERRMRLPIAVFPYFSDQPYFSVPLMLYGPGDEKSVHTEGDKVHSKAIEETRQNIDSMIKEFAVFN